MLHKIRNAVKHKTPQPYPDLKASSSLFVKKQALADDGTPLGMAMPLDILFAEEFVGAGGQFIFCEDEPEFLQTFKKISEDKDWRNIYCWNKDLQELFAAIDFRQCRIGRNLHKAHVGLTFCEVLVARTGSILLSSALDAGRTLSVFPPVHVVIAYAPQLVYDVNDALLLMQQRYGSNMPSMISLATGPSRTADIEKTLVLGAHGPKEVYVFMIDGAM